ncbi:Cell death activator CIDE-A [Nymphon striatum]|nr:Cell death activator CIDE-A [Nymphon striatum]
MTSRSKSRAITYPFVDWKPKPYKVWSADRMQRRAIMVSSLVELIARGKDKLCIPATTEITVTLESDGTEIDDDRYFRTLKENTVLMFLKRGDKWFPPGIEAIRAGFKREARAFLSRFDSNKWFSYCNHIKSVKATALRINLARIICDVSLIFGLGTSNIKFHTHANKIRLDKGVRQGDSISPKPFTVSITAFPKIVCEAINSLELLDKEPSWKIMDNKGRVTVVLHWDQREIRKAQEDRDKVFTVEFVTKDSKTIAEGRPKGHADKGPNHVCDFHCGSVHGDGPESSEATSANDLMTASVPGANSDINTATSSTLYSSTGAIRKTSTLTKGHLTALSAPLVPTVADESESDTETTTNDDDQLTERYLLLVDHLSRDQSQHLTIKDIGIILERLSSKIVDVDKLERDTENSDIHNWTIKATIKGEVLREIGVIYKGQYYGIMEHPEYF